MRILVAALWLLMAPWLATDLGAQVVGQQQPTIGDGFWSDSENWVAAPAVEFEIAPLPAGVDVFVFFKTWDNASRELLLRADTLARKEHEKPLVVRAFAESGADRAEVKAFQTDTGVAIPVYKAEPDWFAAWTEMKELPWVVVVKWTSVSSVTFVGVDEFEKAAEESLAKSAPDPCPRWSQSKQKTRTALKDAISAAYKYQFAKAIKEAEAAVTNFKGDEKDKKDLEGFRDEFETQAAIVRGRLTILQEKLRNEGNWLRLREARLLEKKWFDHDDAWLNDGWKTLTKEPKVQKELQRQEAFLKLMSETKEKSRKDRAKLLRDFAKKNKGSLASTWAEDVATALELADKKFNVKDK